MIVRTWRGRAAADHADAYQRHLVDSVVPKLKALPGFWGATLLRRADGNEIEFVVQTEWESMAAIEGFAGPTPEVAVVDPEARAVLVSFDAIVVHYDGWRLAG